MKKILFIFISFLLCAGCNAQAPSEGDTFYFKIVNEPNEKAFSVLVPEGWQTRGGIFRLDPTASGGAGNSIAAKYDFAVYNNTDADVQIRWLPEYLFMDMRNAPARDFFPVGSNYNGMEVKDKTDAVNFIMRVVIPYAHPGISNVVKTGEKPLHGLAQAYQDAASLTPMLTMHYDAALVTVEYIENSRNYEEIIVAVVEDYGNLGAGLWGNKSCLFIRAPKGELKKWAPILETIHTSVKIDVNWLKGEIAGQRSRGETLINIQQQIQNIDNEITAHRQKTNQEIQNDMYLTLTDQEEYVNPHTNEIEMGTNQWKHRWQNDLGEIIYTDAEDYDPNHDPNLHVSGFKRSAVRKR